MMKWIWAHFRFWLRASICMLIDLVSSNSICVFEASPAARLRLRSPRFAAVCHGSQQRSALNSCLCFVFAFRCPVLSLLLCFSYSSRSGIWFLVLSLLFFVYSIRCPVLSLLLFFYLFFWFCYLFSDTVIVVAFCLFLFVVFRYSCCWCFSWFSSFFLCSVICCPVLSLLPLLFCFLLLRFPPWVLSWDPVGSRTGLTCLVSFFYFLSAFSFFFLIILCLCFASSFLFSFVLFL